MFPILGPFLKDNKSFLENVKEVNDFIKVTFTKYLQVLDKNDQRSFIDAFLVKQQEVVECQQPPCITSLLFQAFSLNTHILLYALLHGPGDTKLD